MSERSFLNKKKSIIKLSANESALGMSKNANKAILKSKNNISKYPDGKFKELTSTISKKYNCKQNQIICGSGSDEIIQMLCQLFLNKGDEVVVPEYSFLMYRIYANIVGAKVIFSKEKNFKVSNDEIIKKTTKRTKIVFIANPNNPTGTMVSYEDLKDLHKKLVKSHEEWRLSISGKSDTNIRYEVSSCMFQWHELGTYVLLALQPPHKV